MKDANERLIPTWDEYYQLIERLADLIRFGDVDFTSIICLARGGSIVGDALSRLLELPLGILMVKSYHDDGSQGLVKIADAVTTIGNISGTILLVDDLVDSGSTFQAVIPWLFRTYPDIDRIETAVLWHKPRSVCAPHYAAVDLEENLWIYQPFEYEKEYSALI